MTELDDSFDGCGRMCRKRGKHTLKWGDCEYGERPAPALGYFTTFTAEDGEVSGGEHEFPLTVFLWWAARLSADEQHQMLAEAAVSDDPAAVIERWRRKADKTAGAITGVTINVSPAPPVDPGYSAAQVQAAYMQGRRQGRHEAGG